MWWALPGAPGQLLQQWSFPEANRARAGNSKGTLEYQEREDGQKKQLRRQTLIFGIEYGGCQKAAEANDPYLGRVTSAAWLG